MDMLYEKILKIHFDSITEKNILWFFLVEWILGLFLKLELNSIFGLVKRPIKGEILERQTPSSQDSCHHSPANKNGRESAGEYARRVGESFKILRIGVAESYSDQAEIHFGIKDEFHYSLEGFFYTFLSV